MAWIEYYAEIDEVPWYLARGYEILGPVKPTWHTWEEGDHLCVKRVENKDKVVVRKRWE